MTKYLISFPSEAMQLTDEELQQASIASRTVVQEAKDAGVWVFGAALDEGVPPVMVDGSGGVTDGTYPQTGRWSGGFTVLEVASRDEALAWAAKLATACRCQQEVRAFHYDPES